MTEERITETETPSGNIHTSHTVVTDDGARSSGGGSGWLIALVLIIVAIVGIYIYSQQSGAEVSKDNAVAAAADNVSEAAQNVGDAAKAVADGN